MALPLIHGTGAFVAPIPAGDTALSAAMGISVGADGRPHNQRTSGKGGFSVTKKRVLVTGAGGFIGHHLVKYLVNRGYWVRGVDIKEPEYEPTHADEILRLDLRRRQNC